MKTNGDLECHNLPKSYSLRIGTEDQVSIENPKIPSHK
jgi:hypothetical protein